jgi:hypothetical protein
MGKRWLDGHAHEYSFAFTKGGYMGFAKLFLFNLETAEVVTWLDVIIMRTAGFHKKI